MIRNESMSMDRAGYVNLKNNYIISSLCRNTRKKQE
jgi:hypothetical protein